MTAGAKTLRLDRLLANLGYGSRRDVAALVRLGQVTLDGKPVARADDHIAITHDLARRMRVNGAPLDPVPGLVLMMHKPVGVTCSHREAGRLVYEFIPERWRHRDPPLSTVGRLDKETSGLLLLTDDGALLHRIIAPKSRVAKRYLATLARPHSGGEAKLFASGTLMLDSEREPLAPAIFEPLSERTAYVTVTEGRYHQVRRMLAAAGNHVEALHRDRIGGLDLPADLAAGAWRVMGEDEVSRLFGA